jgi:ribosomal protein S18 acetylase RimI-like enzyme
LRIRPASADDHDSVRELVRRAYTMYIARMGMEPAPMRSDYAALIREDAVTVAVDRGEIVGVLVLRRQPDSLLLENVAVAPERQGHGIGRTLIAFAEQRALQLSLAKVTLYTNALMTENLSLYQRLGYREVGRRQEYGFDRVFFEKAVARP